MATEYDKGYSKGLELVFGFSEGAEELGEKYKESMTGFYDAIIDYIAQPSAEIRLVIEELNQ